MSEDHFGDANKMVAPTKATTDAGCWGCVAAETDPLTGKVQAGCLECEARSVAHSPTFADAAKSDALTDDYRAVLVKIFGGAWKDGHWRTKAWAQRLDAAKVPQP